MCCNCSMHRHAGKYYEQVLESWKRTDDTMYLRPSSCRSGSTRKCRGGTSEPWAGAESAAALPATREFQRRCCLHHARVRVSEESRKHASACRCGERNGETAPGWPVGLRPNNCDHILSGRCRWAFTEHLANVEKLGQARLIPHKPLHAENLLHFTDTSSLC